MTKKLISVVNKSTALASKPAFHLVYLVFYFFPWLFQAPSNGDIIAIVLAIALFLPIYFHASDRHSLKCLPHIIAFTLIGFIVSPFFGSHGVFHVYACAQSGFIRPVKSAWVTAVVVSLIYAVFSLVTKQAWWDLWFPLFMGLLVLVGTISTADNLEKQSVLRRTNEYDQQMAALAERERIAQDLHDLLGQTLTMVTLKSEVALKLIQRDPERAQLEITEIRDASREALNDVRSAVSGMNTTTIDAELRRAKKILTSANIKTSVNGHLPQLEPHVSHILGLAVREAVTNIVRHSQANEAELTLDIINQVVTVAIHDDGVAKNIKEGSGLRGIRRRLEAIGGSVMLNNNAGMRVTLNIPMVKAQA